MPYSSIVFNEGEPLDPNKLNQLQTNLADIYKTSNSLYNATVNDQGSAAVPIVHFGSVNSGPLTANKSSTVTVSPPSSFDNTKDAFIIASVGQHIGSSIISVYAQKTSDKYNIYVVSNVTRESVLINYLMIQQKTV